ncbi:MAG TPA: AarF/UbiB family protein [Bacillota bacterium]|nr:AarF/UbiB family protein [Bacillota bacterium]
MLSSVRSISTVFFHADPHPGNLGVVPGETIFFMDFGQVGRLNEELKERLVALVLAIVREDVSAIVNILIEMGDAADTVDAAKLKKDIDRVMLKYYALPIQQLKLGDLMKEMLHMAYHYQIRVPSEIVLLAKTLVTLEGVVKQLDPTVSVVDLAEPFGKVLLKEKFAFGRLVKLTGNNLMELGNMAVGLPRRVDNLLYQMERGRLKLQVEHKRLRENVNKLCGALDRLSISVIVAAVILGTCLLSLKSQRTLIWKLPVAEVGLLIGLAMGFWLLVSIIRSARR